MRSHAVGAESCCIAHAFDNARHERCAIELAHFLGDADECVHQRLIVDDHVLVLLARALLQRIRISIEERSPECAVDELEEVEDARRAGRCALRLAVEEQVEQLDADGIACSVQA